MPWTRRQQYDARYPAWISQKGASLLVAAVQFIFGLGAFVVTTVTMQDTSRTAFFGMTLACAMNMWLGLVLCVGVNMNRPFLILLWLGWAAVILILFVVSVPLIALYSYALTELFRGIHFAFCFIMYGISFFLHCLFIHVVYGYYEGLVLAQMAQNRENIGQQEEPFPAAEAPILTISTGYNDNKEEDTKNGKSNQGCSSTYEIKKKIKYQQFSASACL